MISSLTSRRKRCFSQEEWVICRIFHKSGEKRTQLLQVQGGHLDASSKSPSKSSLPPLLASPTSFTLEQLECQSQSSSQRDFQSPILIHHQRQNQNDLSHSNLFPLHAFQPSFPASAASAPVPGEITHTTNHELIFKSQLSQQNCTLKVKEETIPKPSKTEATFYPYQQLLDNANNMHSWMDKLNQNPTNFQNPNPIDMDGGLMGFSGTANAEFRDMSAFNKAGLQQMLDAPIGIDSWPLAQHV